ncbi:MAG: hypothetical protein AB1349_01660 [Elusimicrobiota bacterium]
MKAISDFFKAIPSGFKQLFMNVMTDISEDSSQRLLDNLKERIKELDEKIIKARSRQKAWRSSLNDAEMLMEHLVKYCETNSTVDIELLKDLLAGRIDDLKTLIVKSDPFEYVEKKRTLEVLLAKLIQRQKIAEMIFKEVYALEKTEDEIQETKTKTSTDDTVQKVPVNPTSVSRSGVNKTIKEIEKKPAATEKQGAN